MPFASGPQFRYVGRGLYESTGPTVYVGERDVITIPAGTCTDLASVPRIFWWLLPPTGAYEDAAFVHDDGCNDLARAHRHGAKPRISPRDIDGMFRRILREADWAAKENGKRGDRIRAWKRWLLWYGVRLGALANPARRAGIARDLPVMFAVTAALLAAIGAALYGLDRLAHAIADQL